MATKERPNQIVHRLINEERRRRGLPWVRWSQEMYLLAKDQANAMAKTGRLFHSDRYALRGGENCWGGKYHYRSDQQLAKDIVNSWMKSRAGHREWLLDPRVKTAGVAISSSRHGTFAAWAFSDQPLPQPTAIKRQPPKIKPFKFKMPFKLKVPFFTHHKARGGEEMLRLPTLFIRKLLLTLLVIGGLGDIIRRGYILFTHQTEPIKSTIIFLVEVGLWFWIISILRSKKYKRSKPSFKLVTVSILGIALVCAFAGIQPLTSYKDRALSTLGGVKASIINFKEIADNEAIVYVQIEKTMGTRDETYYTIKLKAGNDGSKGEVKLLGAAIEDKTVLALPIRGESIRIMLQEIKTLYDKEYENAKYEYSKFMHDHAWEMIAGEFGLGNISYDELQRLIEKEKALEAEVYKYEAKCEALKSGHLPSDFDVNRFCRKYIQVIIEKDHVRD